MRLWDSFWHKTLGRPFQLARTIEQDNGGPTVILLHGIGRSGEVWQHVVERLADRPHRVVAFDMLGFGASPKPDWLDYTVDDHASAVIASIDRLKPAGPVVLVGHSMGCLVAVRIARRRPELVKHLVLYEMPLYEGLPDKKIYRLRLDLYFKFYQRVIAYKPTFDATSAKLVERLGNKIAGLSVDRDTWQPFIRSLEHTIMRQTAAEDIKQLAMPMDVIYGSYDMFVIRGKPQQTFGSATKQVSSHTVRARHTISERASSFIVERIDAIEYPESVPASKRPLLKGLSGVTKRKKTT